MRNSRPTNFPHFFEEDIKNNVNRMKNYKLTNTDLTEN